MLWKTGRRLKLIPAGLPRDHTPIPLALRYTLQPQRGEASTGLAGIRWDLQAMADCLPKGDKRLSALRRKLVKKHSAENRWESIGRHAGTWATARTAQAHVAELAAARRTSLESDLHRALRNGRRHEVHRLTQLLGGSGVGSASVSSFTCLVPVLKKKI